MMRKQKEHDLEVRAEINVTSLVDVAFTLLIIFIITAPILQGGIEVDLPQGEVAALPADEDQLIVSVLADGSIALGESMVDREAFQSSFEQLIAGTQPTRILIKSDSAASYAAWFQVASIVKESGIPMGLIGQELPRR